MVQHLPYCQTLEEKRCIDRIGERAKKLIVKNPCIQMLYKGVKTTGKDRDKCHATYRLIFEEPPMVQVKEEYLIYDAVSFISVIGGCLGLCIGISFYNMTGIFLGCLELGLKWRSGGLQKSKAAISHLEGNRNSLPNEASWA